MVEEQDRVRVELAGELEPGPLASEPGPRGRVYRAVLIRPGEWAGKGIRCSAEVLERSAPLFNGLASFLNPPPPQLGEHGYPGLERLLGVTENARWDEESQAVVADYRLADTDTARWFQRLVDGWLRERADGRPVPAVGLSAVPWVMLGPKGEDGLREVVDIVNVDQVDAVYKPAAGGEFVQVLAAQETAVVGPQSIPEEREQQTMDEQGGDSMSERLGEAAVARPPAAGAALAEAGGHAGRSGAEAQVAAPTGSPVRPAPAVEPDAAAPGGAGAAGEAAASRPVAALAESAAAGVLGALRDTLLDGRLALSGLPERWQRVIRSGLPETWTTAELDAAIARIKAACAEEESTRTVQGVRPQVSGMLDGTDRVTEALTALLEGRSPRQGVRPLSGIREAYLLLSGDYEMTGLFHADRVQLANVSSTTMANVVANVLNKVVVNEFQTYPKWWAPIVRTEGFSTLQTVKWITLGGVGELPAVAEGAAYTELTWDDSAENASWQKRGGYLGITLEAMDKDDVGRLRNAPRALAQAAWLTLGKSISGIFTTATGTGPTLSDTKALFHTDHANLGTTALSSSTWAACKLAMRKQAELNSGERLGGLTAPKFLLVPPDLEATALIMLGSEGLPGGANNDVNVDAEGNTHDARLASARRRVIVVDLWTDTNNWAAVADPRLYPTIGVGFRYGETPEIFSVATPTNGLMFSHDMFPVKVRWFFAVGAMDYRGLYKANVA